MAAHLALAPELRALSQRIALRLGNRQVAAIAARLVKESAPDERLALAFLLKLAEQTPELLRNVLADPAAAADLVFLLGASEFVAMGLCALDHAWSDFFAGVRAQSALTLMAEIDVAPDAIEDQAFGPAALAAFKARNFLKIAAADLLGRLTVQETMGLMSALAEQCVRAGLTVAAREFGERIHEAGQFCVLAVGKLGARELNLSSDIDLFYLFDAPDAPQAHEAATRLAEILTELLSVNCFRVDLRLRPGGRDAALVSSLEAAVNFYETLGETWQRAALLRARPIAGALQVGDRFVMELSGFVYRRYLDFDTLRQLRAMKRRVEEGLGRPEMVARNIKLGYGGIRELEFAVHALSLIYGGRDPRLRAEQTLLALERMERLGYLAPERARELADAYLFLRDVEHKLQVVNALQTHVLPDTEAGRRALAARLGLGKDPQSLDRFESTLKRHRELVATMFRETLAGEQPEGPSASAQARAAWRAALDPEAASPLLGEFGFANPSESAGHLFFLARGPEHALASPRRREVLDRIGPSLIEEIRALPDPGLALMNFAAFIAAIGARTSFLALLEERPTTRRVLLRLFASSRYLSALFIRHPEMLDTLVRSDLGGSRRGSKVLEAELSALIDASSDFESRLDALRALRHQEFLRIAIADLAGILQLEEVQAELTVLAEAVLRQALALASRELASRWPLAEQPPLCAIAMGRLGAGEMAYNSDLDLIFVYGVGEDGMGAEGREPATRIVQKLIAVLETRTREGYAYKLDLRLRPSGNQGPAVASLEGFRAYHRQSSALWERQALVRARVVAGDAALGAEVEEAREEFVFARGLSADGVREIAAMRERIEGELGREEHGRLNIKQGRGGLLDVEFLTQMMALRHGWRHPGLRGRATLQLLRALAASGLAQPADARDLESDYRFLSTVENRLRIETDQPAWALSTSAADLLPLARRMGYQGDGAAAELLDELQRRRQRIRQIYDRYFGLELGRG